MSEQTYVDQGLYWEKSAHPILRYIASRYRPDLLLVGDPVTDEFSHQFLGLITPTVPGGDANPAYDDVDIDGVKDGRVAQRRAFIETAYAGADHTLALARSLMGRDPTTFVSSDHGFAPQFLAIDASLPLVNLGLLSGAADEQLPARDGRRDHRQGQGLLGRRRGADLPERRRARPGSAARQRAQPHVARRHAEPELHPRSAHSREPGRRHGRRDQGGLPRPDGPERLDA